MPIGGVGLAAAALGAMSGGRQKGSSVRRRVEHGNVELDVENMAECVELQTCEWTLSGVLASFTHFLLHTQFDFPSLVVRTSRTPKMRGVVAPLPGLLFSKKCQIFCLGYGFRLPSLTLGLLMKPQTFGWASLGKC